MLKRIDVTEPPKSAPQYMLESRMMAETGVMPNVSGRRSETPFGAPSPGSTPTRMPRRTPTTISTRCCQLSAMVKPCRSASRFSTQALLPPLPACGERAEPPLSGARLAERSEARVRGWGERSPAPLTRSASPSRPLPAGGERVGRAEAHREPPQNPSAAPRRPRGRVTWKAQSNMTYSDTAVTPEITIARATETWCCGTRTAKM